MKKKWSLKAVLLACATGFLSAPALAKANSGSSNVEAVAAVPSPSDHVARSNASTQVQLEAIERSYRQFFQTVRGRTRLKAFVGESIGIAEKVRQLYDLTSSPVAT